MNNKNLKVIPISLGMVSVFVIKGDETVLIDTGIPGSEDVIMKKMIENGINPLDVKLIILTHAHNDHYGSARALKEKTGAKIAIHKLDAENLRLGKDGELCPINTFGKIFSLVARMNKMKVEGIEPDIIIDNEFELGAYGIAGKIISTPGHTPGSISVILENKQVIVGDLIMAFFPKTKPNYPMVAHDISEVKKSIKKVMMYSPNQIYISHGGPFTAETIIKRFGIYI